MNERLKNAAVKLKNPKVMIIIGVCGILLILLSELPFFGGGGDKSSDTGAAGEEQTLEGYREELTESIEKIVATISGDTSPTVVITLDTAVKYSYADLSESDYESSSSGDAQENREAQKRSYITVKNSDGSEQPLVVTQIMPQIRGVAIVCRGGDDEQMQERIENAVTAALNITGKRVCILGGVYNEKG